MKPVSTNEYQSTSAGFRLLNSVIQECNERCVESSPAKTPSISELRKRNWEGDQVRVRLGDVLPILLQAAVDQSAWLDDFENEVLIVGRDLHEILTTYRSMRDQRRRAA